MRTFYLTYSKGQTVSDEFRLSWSHYLMLMRIDGVEEHKFFKVVEFDHFKSQTGIAKSILQKRLI
ncbi:MAG: hypothetical protein JZU53_07905 [Paludibacter sp.]|jgi:hypothetical protein|nr:hypothetical protein [Paludibacter sp.]